MRKVILIPDSFKGTMSSSLICDIMEEAVKKYYPSAEIQKIPVADGGEGSVDAFLQAAGGTKVYTTVKGPYFEDMDAFYGMLDDGKTAVIEMAACAGLPLVGDKKNPSLTTTYGVGQLILDAVKKGAKHVIVGLGGSATNDAGTGAAAACGVVFFDRNRKSFVPTGGTLKDIAAIDAKTLNPYLKMYPLRLCVISTIPYSVRTALPIFSDLKKERTPPWSKNWTKGCVMYPKS